MDVAEARKARDLLIQARIVLHRARSEREQPKVDRVILPRQPCVMAQRFWLAEPGKPDRPASLQIADAGFEFGQLRKINPGLIHRPELEQQGFLQHQRPVAGGRRDIALLVGGRRWPPARWVDAHRAISLSAASRAVMSSWLTVSVTATTRPLSTALAPG